MCFTSHPGQAESVAPACISSMPRKCCRILPTDLELVSLSQTFGDDRIVEEFVIRFTHTLKMDWMLPGVAATNRKVEFVLVGIVGFQDGKVASEHLYWDQATVLYQLGILDHPTAAAGLGSTAQLLKLSPQTVAA